MQKKNSVVILAPPPPQRSRSDIHPMSAPHQPSIVNEQQHHETGPAIPNLEPSLPREETFTWINTSTTSPTLRRRNFREFFFTNISILTVSFSSFFFFSACSLIVVSVIVFFFFSYTYIYAIYRSMVNYCFSEMIEFFFSHLIIFFHQHIRHTIPFSVILFIYLLIEAWNRSSINISFFYKEISTIKRVVHSRVWTWGKTCSSLRVLINTWEWAGDFLWITRVNWLAQRHSLITSIW